MIDTKKTYTSNSCGDFIITKYEHSHRVTVKFLSTGFETVVQAGHIRAGCVKDKYRPSVFGVGYVGEGEHRPSNGRKGTKPYRVWIAMLSRCYDPKYHKLRPTYIGAAVCKEWHNFQNFAGWFSLNYVKGFHLDKDIKQRGIKDKIYSPQTCVFVSKRDNSIESQAKKYKMRDPSGVVHEIYNMAEFARSNGLTRTRMSAVYLGVNGHHKGWTKA